MLGARAPRASHAQAEVCGQCVVCGHQSASVVWREKGYEGRACVCGTVYTEPPPPADSVETLVDGHDDSYYAAPARRRLGWLRRHRAGGRLLEVGCGEGHFLVAAQAAGYEVAGIEAHPARAARASARLGVPVECAMLESCSPGAARFDVVYHCDLLSHFADPLTALRSMAAYLAPDGILAFEVGLLGGVAPWWYTVIGTLGYPQHRWLYSERSFMMLLARADLHMTHCTRFGLGLGTLVRGGLRAAARGYRRLRRVRRSVRGDAATSRGRVARFAGTESFWRYSAGRLLPRFGPATLFVIATPRRSPR